MPFTLKFTLKILHIRQTGQNHAPGKPYESRALLGTEGLIAKGLEVEEETVTTGKTAIPYNKLQDVLDPTFRDFLEWAFGSKGISSLQMVAFGDFSHARKTLFTHNLYICRAKDGDAVEGATFRVFDQRDNKQATRWDRYIGPHKRFLRACPMGPFVPIEGEVY